MKCQGTVCLYCSVSFATSAQQDYVIRSSNRAVQPPNTPSWPIHHLHTTNKYIRVISKEFNRCLRLILPVREIREGGTKLSL